MAAEIISRGGGVGERGGAEARSPQSIIYCMDRDSENRPELVNAHHRKLYVVMMFTDYYDNYNGNGVLPHSFYTNIKPVLASPIYNT